MKPIHGNTLDFDLLEQELSLFQQSISDVHSDLRGYHRVVEELLAEAEAKEEDKALASVDHLEEPRRSELLAMRIPYWWSQTFVPHFRASFVVWAVSVLELHLEWASRLAGGFAQTPLACADLAARSTVARYEKFFSRLAGFEAPANDASCYVTLGTRSKVCHLTTRCTGRLTAPVSLAVRHEFYRSGKEVHQQQWSLAK